MTFDAISLLKMLSMIHADLDTDTVERRFFELASQTFNFDRLALFFVKHRKAVLQGKLGRGFADNEIESLEIPLSDKFIFTMSLITGMPVWKRAITNDPYVKSLGLTHFAVIPVITPRRISCWEVTACQQHNCPAYGNSWLRCWLISDRKCGGEQNLTEIQRLHRCKSCPVFQEGSTDDVEGVLLVDNSISKRAIPEYAVTVLSLIGHTVGSAINNAKRFEHTLQVSIKDDLTGIHNRRYFNERLVDELERVSRYPKAPASLLMLDIDFFKKVNDSRGHKAGDAVLVWFAEFLASAVRKSDTVARYGGEEFVVLLINTTKEAALEVAEDLRRRIETTSQAATGVAITASFGVATYGEDATSVEHLLAQADKALYSAKAQGRNRVCPVPK